LEDLDKLQSENMISKTHSNFAKNNVPNLMKSPSQTDPNMKFYKPSLGKSSSSINLVDEKYKEAISKNLHTGENCIIKIKQNTGVQKKQYYIPYELSSRNKSFNMSNTNFEDIKKKDQEFKDTNTLLQNFSANNPKNIVNFRYDLCSPQEFSILEIVKKSLILAKTSFRRNCLFKENYQ